MVLAAALAGTFLLFAGIAMRVAVRARQVTVPDFVGKPVADATSRCIRILSVTNSVASRSRSNGASALSRSSS